MGMHNNPLATHKSNTKHCTSKASSSMSTRRLLDDASVAGGGEWTADVVASNLYSPPPTGSRKSSTTTTVTPVTMMNETAAPPSWSASLSPRRRRIRDLPSPGQRNKNKVPVSGSSGSGGGVAAGRRGSKAVCAQESFHLSMPDLDESSQRLDGCESSTNFCRSFPVPAASAKNTTAAVTVTTPGSPRSLQQHLKHLNAAPPQKPERTCSSTASTFTRSTLSSGNDATTSSSFSNNSCYNDSYNVYHNSNSNNNNNDDDNQSCASSASLKNPPQVPSPTRRVSAATPPPATPSFRDLPTPRSSNCNRKPSAAADAAIPPPPPPTLSPSSYSPSSSSSSVGAYPTPSPANNNNHNNHNNKPAQLVEIEVSPGIYLPLRGSQETLQAVESCRAAEINCMACQALLFCVPDCELVLCPDCRILSPVTDNNNNSYGQDNYEQDRLHHSMSAVSPNWDQDDSFGYNNDHHYHQDPGCYYDDYGRPAHRRMSMSPQQTRRRRPVRRGVGLGLNITSLVS